MIADPWYDYLALPIAPLVLLVQAASLFVNPRWLRWAFSVACAAAIFVMFVYVVSLPTEGEGANIGAGVLFLELALSILLLGVGLVREAVEAIARRARAR